MSLYASILETPVGGMLALVRGDGVLVALPFLGPADDPERTARRFSHGEEVAFDATPCELVARQLAEYFSGERQRFDLSVAPEGTAFQLRVWRALVDIPYGRTVGYGELARKLDRPEASRAVGRANAANPIPVILPCHRVVGADGSLTGYGGGLDRKRFLLRLEGALPEQLAFDDDERGRRSRGRRGL
jgi:methylated-DNA-[protein]-cysteine S-methyltransferase